MGCTNGGLFAPVRLDIVVEQAKVASPSMTLDRRWRTVKVEVRAVFFPVPEYPSDQYSSNLVVSPTHLISVHQSAIRALAWVRVPPTNGSGVPAASEDPTIIASGGYDGVECLTDIREPHGNVVNRTRGKFISPSSDLHRLKTLMSRCHP